MRTRISIAVSALLFVAACATPPGTYPSLAPRAAEAIDPRVPIPNEVTVGPADAALSSRLAALIDQAKAGDSAFRSAAESAERLSSGAGSAKSESWIAAQQALSVAQKAREPTTRAMGDIDEIAATALRTSGGIPAGNLAAIQSAQAAVSDIDRRQSERIEAIEARLGS